MLTIACLRHAATAWNDEGRMQGRRDVPLSPAGRADVSRWRLPDEIAAEDWASSPLSRAVETAQLLSGRLPSLVPELIEMDWGAFEGRRLVELRAELGDAFTRNERRGLDFRPDRGESPREVVSRVTHWLDAIAERGKPLVAVTHNGVLRALLACATGWDMTGPPPVKLRPATFHRFAVERGRLALLDCNVPLVVSISATRSPPRPPAPSAALP